MGKKYLNTKEGSIEQSILDVWQEAAEMRDEGMDGRTKEYRSHRGKLESNRVKRENKKSSVKTEQPETQDGAGEHAFEVGTDRYAEYTAKITPGQIEEALDSMTDESFDSLLEELEDDELDALEEFYTTEDLKEKTGLLKKVGKAILSRIPGTSAKRKRIIGKAKKRETQRSAKAKKVVAKKKEKSDYKAAKGYLKTKKKASVFGAEYDPTMNEREENMTENLNLRDTIKNLWVEAASAAVDPKDREELDLAPEDTAKKMKRAKEPAPNVSEEVELDEASGDKEAYKKFFNAALKKFKVSSPAELKGDDKKKFFDYIDKGWEADNEKAEGAMSQVREFKIQSMKAALAQVWGMEEGHNPFKTKNDKKEDDEKNGNTLTGKKKATVDINPDTVSSKSY